MIIQFGEPLRKTVDGIEEMQVEGSTVQEGLLKVMNRFPQLTVLLSEVNPKKSPWCVLRDGALLLEIEELQEGVDPETVITIDQVIPQGAFVAMAFVCLGLVVNVAVAFARGGPPQPTVGVIDDSATYSFDNICNTTTSGAPTSIVYGTYRVGGHVLNVYTKGAEGEMVNGATITQTWLYEQIGLCEGEIESVTDVQVNNQPVTYYNAVYTAPDTKYIRLGGSNQELMEGFDTLENTRSFTQQNLQHLDNAPSIPSATETVPVYGILTQTTKGWSVLSGYYKY